MINPHTIFTSFARLKFFYLKFPFTDDFYTILKKLCTHNQHFQHTVDHDVQQIFNDIIYSNQLSITCSEVPLTLIIAWPLKQPIFFMKTYWKVLLSSFGALVPVIRRDQKFKSNSNDSAADRENLICNF
jgi:hypothetical protein